MRLPMTLWAIVVLTICPIACRTGEEQRQIDEKAFESYPTPALGSGEEQRQIDMRAFERARKASEVDSWDAALAILNPIDIDKIDDPEVIEYVEFSWRCAKLANELGIDPNCNPDSPTDVIAKIGWVKIIATLLEKITNEGPVSAGTLLADARKIQQQIPRYIELDSRLVAKYNIGG